MFHAPIWQRALVFLSTIPITIAMNGFRIGLIGVTVDRWGTQMAEGVLHLFEGWVIFLACAVLLAAEMYVLARLSGRGFFEAFYVPTVSVKPLREPVGSRLVRFMPLVACLSLLCGGGLALAFISVRSEIVPERTRFVAFPTNLGQWQGRASNVDPWVEIVLAAEDYILSDYSRSDGRSVNLWVAYYSSQRKGESPHSPLVCIPGNGWQITRIERTSLANVGAVQPLNRVIIQKDAAKEVVYYWYEERGRKIASEYWSKWYLLSDSIIKNRSDGALVRLITQVYPGEVEADADERLRAFMQNLEPRLSEFLPGDTSPGIQSAQYEAKDK
jgi:exosortase D (VPLPA-CTERM-specific)